MDSIKKWFEEKFESQSKVGSMDVLIKNKSPFFIICNNIYLFSKGRHQEIYKGEINFKGTFDMWQTIKKVDVSMMDLLRQMGYICSIEDGKLILIFFVEGCKFYLKVSDLDGIFVNLASDTGILGFRDNNRRVEIMLPFKPE